MPERYTHGHHESVLRSHAWRTVGNSAAYLEPYLIAGSTLLDVGSGPGTITAEFAQRLAPGRVVGVDAAAVVVDAAAADAAHVGNLEYVVADAYALPFDDGEFDVAHAHQVLQHLADPVAALREMRRVVRPGGVVAARDVDYAGTLFYPEVPALTRWLELYHQVARGNGGEPDAGRRLTSWARRAGFRDIRSTATIWCFATAADREWWGGMWADRVVQSAFATDAVSRALATEEELQMISDGWREWSDRDDATMMMPHGEIICVA